jgi:DNA-binding transcriptional ArsR family regulator
MTLFKIVSDPERAKLIALLYEGYGVSRDEMLRELNVKPKKLDSLLDATEGLWDTRQPDVYKLTERGMVAYGIIKSKNVKVKKGTKKPEPKYKFLESIKEEISRRFL